MKIKNIELVPDDYPAQILTGEADIRAALRESGVATAEGPTGVWECEVMYKGKPWTLRQRASAVKARPGRMLENRGVSWINALVVRLVDGELQTGW